MTDPKPHPMKKDEWGEIPEPDEEPAKGRAYPPPLQHPVHIDKPPTPEQRQAAAREARKIRLRLKLRRRLGDER